MANRVEYIKIARIDQDGNDLTNALEALTQLTIPYSNGNNAVYPIQSTTRRSEFFLYKVGQANYNPNPNDSGSLLYEFTGSIGGTTAGVPNDVVDASGRAAPFSTINGTGPSVSFLYDAPNNRIQLGTYPEKPFHIKTSNFFVTCSAECFVDLYKSNSNGLVKLTNSTSILPGGNKGPFTREIIPFGATSFLPGDVFFLGATAPSVPAGGGPFVWTHGGSDGKGDYNPFSIFITSSVASGPYIETIPEPYLASQFYGTDCDVLLNNVDLYRENPFLQDVDYSSNPNIPVNFQLIISGTAARGTIPESYYTSLAQTRIRYTGVKNQSEKVNAYPPNGRSFTLDENFFQASPITGITSSCRISNIDVSSQPAIVVGSSTGMVGGFTVDPNLDSTLFRSVEAINYPSWGTGDLYKANVLELNPAKLKTLAKGYSNLQIYFNISAEVDVLDGNSASPDSKLQVGLFAFSSGSTPNLIPRPGDIIAQNGANSYYVSTQNALLQNDTLNQQVNFAGTIPISKVTNNRKYLGLAISGVYVGTDATRFNFSNVSVGLSIQGVPLNIGTFGQTSPIDSLDTSIYEFEWGGGTTPEILGWGAVKLGKILQVSSKDLVKTINASDNANTITIPSKRGTTLGRARNYRVIVSNPSGSQYPPSSVNTSSISGVHFWDTPQNVSDYYQILNGNNPVNTEISMFMYPNSTAGSNPTLPSTTKIATTEWGVPTISNYALTSSNSAIYGQIASGNNPNRFIALDRNVHISKVGLDQGGYYQSAANPIKPNYSTIGDQINHDLNEGEKWFVTLYNEFEFPGGSGDYNSALTTGSLSPFNDGITIDDDGNYSNVLGYKGVYEIAGVYDNFGTGVGSFTIMLYDNFPDFGGTKNIGGNIPGNSLGMLIWKARAAGKNEFVIVQDEISGGVQGGAFINKYAPDYLTENFEAITKEYGGNQTG